MPLRHTRRWLLRLACVLAVAGATWTVGRPAAAVAADETHRLKGSGRVANALLVQMHAGVSDGDAASALSTVRANELARFDDSRVRVVSVARGDRDAARRGLLADPRVESVSNDATASATLTPSDPYWDTQWNMRRVRGTDAWDSGRGDGQVIIAVVDTGVDPNHPDLRGRVMRGWDFQNDDSNPYDDDGHGTAVATTALAAGNDGVGIAGMCWRCRIMPVKVLNSNGHGTHSNIAAGIRYAAQHGADVINLSIAGLSSTVVLEDAVRYALRRGVVVVAAAGNDGTTRRTYPAAYDGVVSVAASNTVDRLYDWSNRGSWVTLAAPGCAFSGRPHARWAWLCGTSLATPVVSGAAGLMRSVAPELGRWRISSLLGSTADRVGINTARGRLDAAAAVRAAARLAGADGSNTDPQPTPTVQRYEWTGTLSASDTWDRETYKVGGQVHVAATWSGASELDIWVQDASGNVILHKSGTALDFDMNVTAGDYAFTVQETTTGDVSYKVVIDSSG